MNGIHVGDLDLDLDLFDGFIWGFAWEVVCLDHISYLDVEM